MRLLFHTTLLMLMLVALLAVAFGGFLRIPGEPPWAPMAFSLAIFGVQYWYAPRIIEWLFAIRWDDDGRELPVRNRDFLRKLCADRGLKMPRIGIIKCNAPNAFTFGHVPADARVVVTTGLLCRLNSEETEAVLAHEMGHVAHWDFVLMTVAALAPLLFHNMYQAAIRANQIIDSNERQNRAPFVAEGSYICCLLSQFLVLLLSRTREYYADGFSARVTGTPNALASALVKIGYGMATVEGEIAEASEGAPLGLGESAHAGALGVMGIANLHGSRELALGGADGSATAALMRWDLVNPWARLYQVRSTHPLIALRIGELNRLAEAMDQTPAYPLPGDRKIRWRAFPLEVLLWATPWIAAGAFAAQLLYRGRLGGMLLLVTGFTWMCRVWLRHYGAPRPATIADLLRDVDVSQMRPRAVRLEGTILGFGVPGAFWCPDLVLRDATGLMFVLYRRSIPFARRVFGFPSAGAFIGHRVTVEGWFRRGLRPYVEIACLTGEDGKPHRAYWQQVQYGAAALLAAGGFLWTVFA